jgi:hypothetical protein
MSKTSEKFENNSGRFNSLVVFDSTQIYFDGFHKPHHNHHYHAQTWLFGSVTSSAGTLVTRSLIAQAGSLEDLGAQRGTTADDLNGIRVQVQVSLQRDQSVAAETRANVELVLLANGEVVQRNTSGGTEIEFTLARREVVGVVLTTAERGGKRSRRNACL